MPNLNGKGLTPNKRGERRGGRQAGTPNKLIVHDEVIAAAAQAGFIKEVPVIKKGKPTGQTRLVATNKEGFRGYLRSAPPNWKTEAL